MITAPTQIQKRAIRRIKIIAGQVRGLERMIAREAYCVDIIHQSSAIKEALSSLEDLLLEKHLTRHMVGQIKIGQEKKAVKEILSIYRLSKKK